MAAPSKGDALSDDADIDFGPEEMEPANVGESAAAIIAKVLETQLAGRIATIIDQQAAQAVERVVKKTSSCPGVGPSAEGGASTSSDVSMGEARRIKADLKVASSMVEEFDPEDKDSNIDRWLSMIDQLGEVHGWSDYDKSYFMQIKLKGAARKWFNRRDDFQLSWAEWKASLLKAFPREHDFAVCLEELVERRKLPDETMTRYFHGKLALCGRAGVEGKKAVACIVRGLPEELRANAYACKSETPEMLYSQFLAGLENYKSPTGGVTRKGEPYAAAAKARRPSPVVGEAKRQVTEGTRRFRCYNCQEYGTHLSRDCRKPRQDRCSYCGETGRYFEKCSKRGRQRGDLGPSSEKTKAPVKVRLGNQQ